MSMLLDIDLFGSLLSMLILVAATLFMVIALVMLMRQRHSDASLTFVVEPKKLFFSEPERHFYTALAPIAESLNLLIFPKVGLNNVFMDRPDAPRNQHARYAQMHLDYLLVARKEFRPVAAIELDGRSHSRHKHAIDDEKKNALFGSAKLPLL